MRRKIYLIYAIYIIIISVMFVYMESMAKTKKLSEPEIYFVDSDMFRLVSVSFTCEGDTPEEQAKAVISELITGRDYNKKITRMIPDIKNCLTVKVKGDTAYVNISGDSVKHFPDGRVSETLAVYQIVNSLTSIDGIIKVKFTVDKKQQKKFKGFIDMRETFIPDYYV